MIDLYTAFKRQKLTASRRHFSTYWCGKAANYLALGGGISTNAMVAIFRRLIARRRFVLAVRVGWLVLFGTRAPA